MLSKTLAALFAILLCGLGRPASAAEPVPDWLVGTWTPVFDEDGSRPDFADFTADGKYVNHGFDCSVRTEMPFHIHNGDIYITYEIPGKGPIAIVFRPNRDGTRLSFTSPRTRNNAVLEKTQPKCD